MLTEPTLFLSVIPGLVREVRGMYSVLAAITDDTSGEKQKSKESKIADE